MTTAWKSDLKPTLQVVDAMAYFMRGEHITAGDEFSILRPAHGMHGVWEMRTTDVRIFGWFPVKDIFICAEGDQAGFIKSHNLYQGYRNSTIRKRNQLDLDEPKFIPGKDIENVVSV